MIVKCGIFPSSAPRLRSKSLLVGAGHSCSQSMLGINSPSGMAKAELADQDLCLRGASSDQSSEGYKMTGESHDVEVGTMMPPTNIMYILYN